MRTRLVLALDVRREREGQLVELFMFACFSSALPFERADPKGIKLLCSTQIVC